MHVPLLLSFLAASALAAEVTIDVTNPVECTRKTQAGDAITVNYRGTLENGEEFDSSYNRAPFQFTLGKGQVIQGWDQGLLNMCIGEKRKLTIPGSLAYGSSRGIGSCKTDCTLLFDTELLGIKGVAKEGPAKEPESEKEEELVSPRQSSLDHVILGFAGLLFVVSGTLFFIRARKAKRAGKGIFGSDKYETVGQHTA
ncbi:hypothetical protein N431DRAFT_541331 [Stipitochalara longipes BDJ]|nr:hypothetical protein N431DRAFT_541331 [Stipitochalara longipes BDJ]